MSNKMIKKKREKEKCRTTTKEYCSSNLSVETKINKKQPHTGTIPLEQITHEIPKTNTKLNNAKTKSRMDGIKTNSSNKIPKINKTENETR